MNTNRSLLISRAIIVLTGAAILLTWNIFRQSDLDQKGSDLVLEVTRSILDSDSSEPLISRALNNEINERPASEYQSRVGSIIRRMGPLNSIISISGGSDIALNPFTSEEPLARYSLVVQFQRGEATITTDLIYHDQQWKFTTYSIDAPALQN